MIKKLQAIATLFFLAFSFQTLSAQQVDVTWGKLNKPERRGTGYTVLDEVSDGIIVMKTDKKGRMYLEKYDNEDYSLVYSREIDFNPDKREQSKKKRLDYEEVLVMNNGVVVFGTKYDKKADRFNLFARKFDFDAQPDGGWEKIESIVAKKKSDKGDFTIKLSADKKTFLVAKALPLDKDNSNAEKFTFVLYSSTLESTHSKDFLLKFKREDKDVGAYTIGKNGKVYFMAENTTNVALYSYSTTDAADGNNFNEYKILLDKKDVTDVAYSFDKEGQVVLSGFYGEKKEKRYGIAGIFYIKLNPETLEPTMETTSAFSKDFLAAFLSAKQIRKGSSLSLTYDMKNFVMKDDGGCILVAEKHYVVQHCSRDPKTGFERCYYTYHYDDLIIINITPDGEIKNTNNIKKYASSTYNWDPRLSYSLVAMGNDLVIFYNDHYKNYLPNAKKIRPLPSYKKTVLAMVVVKDDGEVEKKALLRQKEVGLQIMTRNAVKVEGGKGLIMLGFYKKSVKFGKFMVTE